MLLMSLSRFGVRSLPWQASAQPVLGQRVAGRRARAALYSLPSGSSARNLQTFLLSSAVGALAAWQSNGRARRSAGVNRSLQMRAAATACAEVDPYLRTKVAEMIRLAPIVIFSKSTCPFCKEAKIAIAGLNVQYNAVELDRLREPVQQALQDVLLELTGARTVPRVFIGGRCIGGGDDVVRLASSGELQQLADSAQDTFVADLRGDGEFHFEKTEAEWRRELGEERYGILRRRGTEAPGSHEYDRFQPQNGHFACGACSLPLYSADSKFASDCGWPVFDKIYESEEIGQHVRGRPDGSGSLEIVCTQCGSHLGHVFYDAISQTNVNGERH